MTGARPVVDDPRLVDQLGPGVVVTRIEVGGIPRDPIDVGVARIERLGRAAARAAICEHPDSVRDALLCEDVVNVAPRVCELRRLAEETVAVVRVGERGSAVASAIPSIEGFGLD